VPLPGFISGFKSRRARARARKQQAWPKGALPQLPSEKTERKRQLIRRGGVGLGGAAAVALVVVLLLVFLPKGGAAPARRPPPPPQAPPREGTGDVWALLLPRPVNVNIKSAYGLYVAALPTGEIRADRDGVGRPWETFTIHFVGLPFATTLPHNNGTLVRLQTLNGRHVGVTANATGVVRLALLDPVGPATLFVLYMYDDDDAAAGNKDGNTRSAVLYSPNASAFALFGGKDQKYAAQMSSPNTTLETLGAEAGMYLSVVIADDDKAGCRLAEPAAVGDTGQQPASRTFTSPSRSPNSIVPETHIVFGPAPGSTFATIDRSSGLVQATRGTTGSPFIVHILPQDLTADLASRQGVRIALQNAENGQYVGVDPEDKSVLADRATPDDDGATTTFVIRGHGTPAAPTYLLLSVSETRYLQFDSDGFLFAKAAVATESGVEMSVRVV